MQALLPLKISGDWSNEDLERTGLLIHSLDHFWCDGAPFELNIVTRSQDIALVKDALHSNKVSIKIFDEVDVLPELRAEAALPGWIKQQAIKLVGHRIIPNELYLTLDADIVCKQPLRAADLVKHGRGVLDWELRSKHASWWHASADMLKTQANTLGLGIGVTPQVLSSEITKELEAWLDNIYGGHGWSHLFKAAEASYRHAKYDGWTEYCLYGVFLDMRSDLASAYHEVRAGDHDVLSLRAAESIWRAEAFASWDPAAAAASKQPFVVIQSNTRIPLGKIKERLAGVLPFV